MNKIMNLKKGSIINTQTEKGLRKIVTENDIPIRVYQEDGDNYIGSFDGDKYNFTCVWVSKNDCEEII